MPIVLATTAGLATGFLLAWLVLRGRRRPGAFPDAPPGRAVATGDPRRPSPGHGDARALTDVAHELRTPLTLIVGNIESVQRDGTDRAEYRLEVARRNARRLHRMVDELLELSRSEAGALELSRVTLDLVEVTRIVVAGFETLADLKDVDLTLTTPEGALPVEADPERLERVLYNLLSNALKFAAGGRVADELVRDGGWARLRVEDDGVGIPEASLPHVFDRFYRPPGDGARRFEGSGVGLALVRELVELHGGEIGVDSVEGEGACFTVRLPLAVGADAPTRRREGEAGPAPRPSWMPAGGPAELATVEAPDALAERVDAGSALVLVVDDNREMRGYVRGCLDGLFRVVEAPDGAAALETAREAVPDLIVADRVMPGLGGDELLRRLRADRVTSHIPVVMLTGRSDEESRLESLESGVDAYLTKPFSRRELQARVSNLIALRQLLRERYARTGVLRPEEVEASPVDRDFLEAVFTEIDAHLGDADFSVEALAKGVHLSTSQLTRKLRALVDQSPGRLIRSQRLQSAAELIAGGAGNLGTVAYRVGFSDQAHFSRSFKKHFGVSPSDYRGG